MCSSQATYLEDVPESKDSVGLAYAQEATTSPGHFTWPVHTPSVGTATGPSFCMYTYVHVCQPGGRGRSRIPTGIAPLTGVGRYSDPPIWLFTHNLILGDPQIVKCCVIFQ